MPVYSKGQIYSIRFLRNDNLIHICSTTQPLAVRFRGHKCNTSCSFYQECHNENFKCCYIELLEYFECGNKQDLNKQEGEIIRKYSPFISFDKAMVLGKNSKFCVDNSSDEDEKSHQEYYKAKAEQARIKRISKIKNDKSKEDTAVRFMISENATKAKEQLTKY